MDNKNIINGGEFNILNPGLSYSSQLEYLKLFFSVFIPILYNHTTKIAEDKISDNFYKYTCRICKKINKYIIDLLLLSQYGKYNWIYGYAYQDTRDPKKIAMENSIIFSLNNSELSLLLKFPKNIQKIIFINKSISQEKYRPILDKTNDFHTIYEISGPINLLDFIDGIYKIRKNNKYELFLDESINIIFENNILVIEFYFKYL